MFPVFSQNITFGKKADIDKQHPPYSHSNNSVYLEELVCFTLKPAPT